MFSPEESLSKFPHPIREIVTRYSQNISRSIEWHQLNLPEDEVFFENLNRVFASSDYVTQVFMRDPTLLEELMASSDLERVYSSKEYKNNLEKNLVHADGEKDLMKVLRSFRHREMARIVWRDFAGTSSLQEIMRDLSGLADACISMAVEKLFQWQCESENQKKIPQRLLIIAVGKLGGEELNFSSDVDLIFCYTDPDRKDDKKNIPSHDVLQNFFTQLVQKIIHVLSDVTEDGFVFRVDTRLRPFGESGSLVMSLAALETYYQNHGRDWERYALVKARVIGGPALSARRLLRVLQAFVYRHYVDYGAISALRQLKNIIEREVRAKNLKEDIKKGYGGIRQIEFIVQAFQLIRGGHDRYLRQRKILKTLAYLKEIKILTPEVVDELTMAYEFLRRVENHLQMFSDRQTHRLPTDPIAQCRLAFGLGFKTWKEFSETLKGYRYCVMKHFTEMIEEPSFHSMTAELQTQLEWLWQGHVEDDSSKKILERIGFSDPEEVQKNVIALQCSQRCRMLTPIARQRLDALMPVLLLHVGNIENAHKTLKRLLHFLEAIMRRSAYLVLLLENPSALDRLVKLFSASGWIADQLTRYPLLLDELLHEPITKVPNKTELKAEILRYFDTGFPTDIEQQMELLRRFYHAQVLQMVIADVMNVLSIMDISIWLSRLAEIILQHTQVLVYQDLISQHGEFLDESGKLMELDFAIIAYGKLGSEELGYSSDLDIVFLHADVSQFLKSNGEKPLTPIEFYLRLAQRIVHMLQTRTTTGLLYKVDTRLRPSGKSGLLVSSIDAFEDYQRHQAWTWEHQALVRARAITGKTSLQKRFEKLRKEILSKQHDKTLLRRDIFDMREKMRQEKLQQKEKFFDVKEGKGGLIDIEFIAQYAVLAWAIKHPALLKNTNTVRIFSFCAEKKLLSPEEFNVLNEAYCAYRQIIHRAALQNEEALIAEDELLSYREGVGVLWERLFV